MAVQLSIRIEEPLRLDGARLVALYAELGQVAADRVIEFALKDISVHLRMVLIARRNRNDAMLDTALAEIEKLSGDVGMSLLARVAADLRRCTARGDPIAQSAVLARLLRLGHRSLEAVWDLQHTRG